MNYELHNMDCLEWMATQSEKSIPLIISSPPYNLKIKYGKYKDDKPRDGYLKWMGDISKAMKRILCDDGHIFLNVGSTNKDPWVYMDVAQVFRKDFVLQNDITWVKHIKINDQSHGIYKPIGGKRFISPTNEKIFHFTKNGEAPLDRLAVGHRNSTHSKYPELYTESRHTAEQRRSISKKLGYSTWQAFNINATSNERLVFEKEMADRKIEKPYNPDKKTCIGNTWYVPYNPVSKLAKEMGLSGLGNGNSARGGHPATFPEGLPDMCIRVSGVAKGSIVYDPFNGTGTTILAAVKNGMYGIGTDVDDNYLEFAKRRIDGSLDYILRNGSKRIGPTPS